MNKLNFLCLYIFIIILQISLISATQCNDGIDNDGDGFVDALILDNTAEGECSDGIDNDGDGKMDYVSGTVPQETTFISIAPDFEIYDFINTLPLYTKPPVGASQVKADQITADKICELKGYSTAQITMTNGPISCADNEFIKWDNSIKDFIYTCDLVGENIMEIWQLKCTIPLTSDDGCSDYTDISEKIHDLDCVDVTDDIEGPGPQCSDGIDNDLDNGIDYLVELPLGSTTNCSDGIDNDEDGKFDFTNDAPFYTFTLSTDIAVFINSFPQYSDIPMIPPSQGFVRNDQITADKVCNLKGYNTATITDSGIIEACVNLQYGHWDELQNDFISEYLCQANDVIKNLQCSNPLPADDGCVSYEDISEEPHDLQCSSIEQDDEDPPTTLSSAKWQDASGTNDINSANNNDLVRLSVEGTGLEDKLLEFTVKRKMGDFLDFIIPDKDVVSGSTYNYATWRAGLLGNNIFREGKYYFEVKVSGTSISISTKDNPDTNFHYLNVLEPESNDPPVAIIVGLEDKQIYFKDTQILFSQNSIDTDDEFSYRWDLGDGNTKLGDSNTLDNYEFMYNYSDNNLGQKNIVLTVTDDRGMTATDRKSILIVNSDFILSYIDQPLFGEIYDRIVNFDAISTYAVNTETTLNGNDCIKDVDCIAGNCPTETKGCPTSYSLNCNYIGSCPVPVSNTPLPHDFLTLCWEFDGGSQFDVCLPGNIGISLTRNFIKLGKHTAKLTSTTNSPSPSPLSSTTVEFDILYEENTCIISSPDNQEQFPNLPGISNWVSSLNPPIDSFNDCYREDGINQYREENKYCCPGGYICNQDNKCITESRISCNEFTSEEECAIASNNDIAVYELNSIVEIEFPGGCLNYNNQFGNSCFEFIECNCEWQLDTQTCIATSHHKLGEIALENPRIWDYQDDLPDDINEICNVADSTIEPIPPISTCNFDIVNFEQRCEDGYEYEIIEWSASQTTNPEATGNLEYCIPDSSVRECNLIKLSFFNTKNLFVTILILVIIYYIIIKYMKKTKKKRKKR